MACAMSQEAHTMSTWGPAIAGYLHHLGAGGVAVTSRNLRAAHLRRLAIDLGGDPWEVTGDQLVAWLGGQAWRRNTTRSYGQSVRSFYRWGHQVGHVATDPAALLPSVAQATPRPRPAPEAAYRAALLAAEPRVALMVRLAGQLGLRRGEVCRVHADDVQPDLVGWSLLVHGKGDRQRTVPMPDDLAQDVLAAAAGGYLFPGGVGGHLGPERVGKLVGQVLPAGVSMHQLRHRFATRAYLVDTDLPVVQQLLGHASPGTTMAYVAVPGEALRRTVLAVAS